MPRQYARFQDIPAGPGQVVQPSGYEVVSVSETLQGHVRSTDPATAPRSGVEWVFYGDDVGMQRVVGLVDEAVSIDAVPGDVAGSLGWRLEAGELWAAGARICEGLAVPAINTVVGLLLDQTATPALVSVYQGTHLAATAYIAGDGSITSPGVVIADDDGYALLDDSGYGIVTGAMA